MDEGFGDVAREFVARDQFQRLFTHLDSRFNAVEARFEALEERVERHHDDAIANFDAVFKRLDELKAGCHVIASALARISGATARESITRGRDNHDA